MLRVMKQKALDQDEEMSLKKRVESPDTVDLRKATGVLVSHVPMSVGSRTSTSSANSSISSKGDDSVDLQQRNPRDDAMVHCHDASTHSTHVAAQDSRNESSRVVELVDLTVQNKDHETASSSNLERPKSARKVSLDESNKKWHTFESPTKKPRLDAGPIHRETKRIAPAPSPLVLLAREQDESALNRLHVFVRNQIEVFTATPTELAQPAPGRKHPIKLHQVGLRCIHCRHLPNRKRVKRAVCYPSSVGRVYHSVSDMKFDHFSNCKELPADLRATFESLKTEGKSNRDKKCGDKGSSYPSSTAQYYHDAALQIGMVNGPGGIFMTSAPCFATAQFMHLQSTLAPRQDLAITAMIGQFPSIHGFGPGQDLNLTNKLNMRSKTAIDKSDVLANVWKHTTPPPQSSSDGERRVPLSEEGDSGHLNPLHCFVRQHVEIFTADKNDISAPAPGRKTRVILGQVGIRCTHCAKLPMKDRVKRAVCYPPSVSGIYHSVSNMKFDHFGKCRGLPPKTREEFETLKSSCSRRGTAGSSNSSRGSASSTAQYYHDSAVRKGLADTDTGIRFGEVKTEEGRKPVVTPPTQPKKTLPTGMSALMMAACQAV